MKPLENGNPTVSSSLLAIFSIKNAIKAHKPFIGRSSKKFTYAVKLYEQSQEVLL